MAYEVTYSIDEESGWWVVEAPEYNAVTQAKTLTTARKRIREALSLFVEDSSTAELVETFRLPPGLEQSVRVLEGIRARFKEVQREQQDASRKAAWALRRAGIGTRDSGLLMDLTHQRVAQLLDSEPE